MIATTHALVGAAAGTFAKRPWWALAAGVNSHALLDLLPHRDYEHRPLWLLLDGCGVVAVLGWAFRVRQVGTLAGAVGGLLPDLENLGGAGNPRPCPKLFPSHRFEHGSRSQFTALVAELCTAAGALLILRALKTGR